MTLEETVYRYSLTLDDVKDLILENYSHLALAAKMTGEEFLSRVRIACSKNHKEGYANVAQC